MIIWCFSQYFSYIMAVLIDKSMNNHIYFFKVIYKLNLFKYMYALIKLPHMKRNVFNVRYIGDGENSTCERRRLVPSDMTDLLRDIDSISLDSRSTGCGGSPPGGSNGTSPHPERRLLARLQEDVNSLSQTNRDQSQVQ